MHAGRVQTLLILDSNPVYTAPGPLDFAEALKRVPFSLALSRALDETSEAVTWAVPMTHEWEDWSDARGHDGTATIIQPQALPLYGGDQPACHAGTICRCRAAHGHRSGRQPRGRAISATASMPDGMTPSPKVSCREPPARKRMFVSAPISRG